MDREVLFARQLKEVRELAKRQGNCIEEAQVREAFSSFLLDEGQMEMVFDYLRKHNVGIGEPAEPEDVLTEEEKNYLEDYLEQIAALGGGALEERKRLMPAAMAGDPLAKKRLLELYLADVADIAKLYAGQGAYLEDLIGEGNVALSMGVEMLADCRDAKEAEGMLVQAVMDAMEAHIAENASAEKKVNKVAAMLNRVMDEARELSESLRRKVTPEELAKESGLSVKQIKDAVRISGDRIEYIDAKDAWT